MLVVAAVVGVKQLLAEQAVVAEVAQGVKAHKMVLLVQQTQAAEAEAQQILVDNNKSEGLVALA